MVGLTKIGNGIRGFVCVSTSRSICTIDGVDADLVEKEIISVVLLYP